ncbi:MULTISPECIES: hypothetical protein [Priestia]|jgi:hypothetical protein|uniref:Endonuclease n=4 Tax=Priestia TaxID=2800373 RepID=D5E1U4_PRIM1|nr:MULTISPECIES: hypothetical protein [Priestia]AVX09588.1 hypothetical protein CS527_18405 [Bacillus sp. Y-01]KOP75708.1 endonuclease [Bacillus sp. FJAT-21351]KQU12893.1 endonuclease [Bacillus sp. Leaf75]KRF57008.1 endonuclease [Bacillus sp. Soil531]MBZ5481269.1 hypothetical protein [Bacillus sp. T_4]MCF6797533.1 hypothetical protein [Bacillus sp. ET1]MCJ7985192.1 hypothetical protein [Priestia sp. OVL9]MDH6653345.1 hypothetical protein [Bacillus sp. PvP124]MDP9576554.1 hypothetical prote
MKFDVSELVEAKRQIDSTLHKLRQTVKTFEAKENADRYKSQITLAKRRIQAFEISVALIEREIKDFNNKS